MEVIRQNWDSLFFGKRFYRFMAAIIFIFVLSYGIPFLFNVAVLCLIVFILAVVLDWALLFAKRNPLSAQRILPDRLSNGDENTIHWHILNKYPFRCRLQLLDEFPEAWQIRNFTLHVVMEPEEKTVLNFSIIPKERGEFFFGDLHIFIKSPLQLILRRKTFSEKKSVKVFPGYLKLRQFEFMAHITDPGNAG